MRHSVRWVLVTAMVVGCGGNDEEASGGSSGGGGGGSATPPAQAAKPATPAVPQSNFGTISLTPNFEPDPHVVQGRSGGNQDAETINPACKGWISPQPDHAFVASANFTNLAIFAASSSDITLVVQQPDGGYRCNDDADQGSDTNPLIRGAFPAGTYKVWVGSYEQGATAEYQLGFSEFATAHPNMLGAAAADPTGAAPSAPGPTARSNFGTIALASGFRPDPHKVDGRSGGDINAETYAAACNGWISRLPDHVVNLTTPMASLRIAAKVKGETDITLVMQRPDGKFLCNDDHSAAAGTNPMIVGNSLPTGYYAIWVGSYEQGTDAVYTLGFSELPETTPETL